MERDSKVKKKVETAAEKPARFLKPTKGRLVRDPRTLEPLSDKGQLKNWFGGEGRYWRRRVNQGDCVIVDK